MCGLNILGLTNVKTSGKNINKTRKTIIGESKPSSSLFDTMSIGNVEDYP